MTDIPSLSSLILFVNLNNPSESFSFKATAYTYYNSVTPYYVISGSKSGIMTINSNYIAYTSSSPSKLKVYNFAPIVLHDNI